MTMRVTAREKKFLIAGGVVVATILLAYLAVAFIPGRGELSETVEFKRKLLLKNRQTLNQEETYKLRVERYSERLKQNMTRLLPGDNPNVAAAELQKVLTDIASANGVEIVRKDIQKEQKIQDNLEKVSVRIETNCVPEQLVQFLAAVANYDKFLTLDNLTVNSFRMQKRYEIRPGLTVSGYILVPATRTEDSNSKR